MTDGKLHAAGLMLVVLAVLAGVGIQTYSSRRQLIKLASRGRAAWWQATQDTWLTQPTEVTRLLTMADGKLQLTTKSANIPVMAEPPATGAVIQANNRGRLAYTDTTGGITVIDTQSGRVNQIKRAKTTNILGWENNDDWLIVSEYNSGQKQIVVSRVEVAGGKKQTLTVVDSQSVPEQWWSLEPIKNLLVIPSCHEGVCQLYLFDLDKNNTRLIKIQNDQGAEFEPRMSKLIFSQRYNRVFVDDASQGMYWVHDLEGKLYHFIHQYPQPENKLDWVGVDPTSFTLIFYSPLKKQTYYYDANYVHFDYLNRVPARNSGKQLNYALIPVRSTTKYQLLNRVGNVVGITDGWPIWWE